MTFPDLVLDLAAAWRLTRWVLNPEPEVAEPDPAPASEPDEQADADDLHPCAEGCGCNPTVVPVEKPDGTVRFVYAHQDIDPAEQADRAATIFEAIAIVRASTD